MLSVSAQIQISISEAHELLSALAWLRDNNNNMKNLCVGMRDVTASMAKLHQHILVLHGKAQHQHASMKIKQKAH